MDIKKIIEGLHPLERKVVPYLDKVKTLSELAKKSGLKEVEAMRALQWLSNKNVLKIISLDKETVSLDVNGKQYLRIGLPEKRLLLALKGSPKTMKDVMRIVSKEEFGIAVGLLKKKAAVEMDRGVLKLTGQGLILTEKESLEETFVRKLGKGSIEISALKPEEKLPFHNLMKRKRIVQKGVEKIKKIELTSLGKQLAKQKIGAGGYLEVLSFRLWVSPFSLLFLEQVLLLLELFFVVLVFQLLF